MVKSTTFGKKNDNSNLNKKSKQFNKTIKLTTTKRNRS